MSVHRLISIDAYCNGCNRAFGYNPDIPASEDEPVMQVGHESATDIREVRRLMREYGWRTFRSGRDMCPKCQNAIGK
jgi:hypothetical protein